MGTYSIFPFIKLISWISVSLAGDPNTLFDFVRDLNTTNPDVLDQLNANTLDLSDPNNKALATQFGNLQYYVSFGLSMFHTVFNLINIFIMIWFTKAYVYIVTKLVSSKDLEDEEESHLTFISSGMLSTAELSIVQAGKEIILRQPHKMLSMVRDSTTKQTVVQKFSRIQYETSATVWKWK